VAVSYLGVAGILIACSKYAVIAPKPVEIDHARSMAAD
jgi:hypothetical protein